MNLKSTIIGTTLLVVLLTAGAAQSLSGTNTVDSGDIIDGQVAYGDIRDNAMTGKKILDNSVTGADVKESTLALPVVFFAQILVDGTKLHGNITSSSHPDSGEYLLTFPRDVSDCAFAGGSGFFPDGSGTDLPYAAFEFIVQTDPTMMRVFLRNAYPPLTGQQLVNADFTVTVTCPY